MVDKLRTAIHIYFVKLFSGTVRMMQFFKAILLYFYTLWAVIVFFFFAMLAVPYYLWVSFFVRSNQFKMYMVYNHFWTNAFSFFTAIKYDHHGLDKLKEGDPHVVVCNHCSIADMFILASSIRVEMRLLGKMEMIHMPLFGYLFSKMLVFVDRSSPESRKESLRVLSELIREKGLSVLIFPEGTRNKTDDPLKSFYDGAFKLAIECQVPVIPLIFTNVKQICTNKRFLFHPGTMSSYYGDPISTEGLTLDDVDMLKEKVYGIMEQMVIEHDDAFAPLRGVSYATANTPAQ